MASGRGLIHHQRDEPANKHRPNQPSHNPLSVCRNLFQDVWTQASFIVTTLYAEIKQSALSAELPPGNSVVCGLTGFGLSFAIRARVRCLIERRKFRAVNAAHRPSHGLCLFVDQPRLVAMLLIRPFPFLSKVGPRL